MDRYINPYGLKQPELPGLDSDEDGPCKFAF